MEVSTEVTVLLGLLSPVIVDLINRFVPNNDNSRFLTALVISLIIGVLASINSFTGFEYNQVVEYATLAFMMSQVVFKMIYQNSKVQDNILKGK